MNLIHWTVPGLILSAFLAGETQAAEPNARTSDVLQPGGATQPSPTSPIGWRRDGTGNFPSAQPLLHWHAKEHARWQAEVGTGQSSPIVVGERLFITAEPDLLICLEVETGKELWRKSHRFSDVPDAPKDPGQSSQFGDATPTPVSDGKFVWVFFGT